MRKKFINLHEIDEELEKLEEQLKKIEEEISLKIGEFIFKKYKSKINSLNDFKEMYNNAIASLEELKSLKIELAKRNEPKTYSAYKKKNRGKRRKNNK